MPPIGGGPSYAKAKAQEGHPSSPTHPLPVLPTWVIPDEGSSPSDTRVTAVPSSALRCAETPPPQDRDCFLGQDTSLPWGPPQELWEPWEPWLARPFQLESIGVADANALKGKPASPATPLHRGQRERWCGHFCCPETCQDLCRSAMTVTAKLCAGLEVTLTSVSEGGPRESPAAGRGVEVL